MRKNNVLTERPGEVRMKAWLLGESERLGIGATGVFMRLKRGKYPWLKVRRPRHTFAFVSEVRP